MSYTASNKCFCFIASSKGSTLAAGKRQFKVEYGINTISDERNRVIAVIIVSAVLLLIKGFLEIGNSTGHSKFVNLLCLFLSKRSNGFLSLDYNLEKLADLSETNL